MIVARSLPALRDAVARLPRPLALVPTMGALHPGHIALLAAARTRAASVAASVFVNPLQFAATEDLARYPSDEPGDLAALDAAGCDLVWMPPVDAMYPPGAATTIEVQGPALGFEAIARPTHFRGVATVVAKLFNQVTPDLAVFGEKDWQQIQVVRRMTADLDMQVEIVPVPTVREPDGLAMSSRNRFLNLEQRAIAPTLHQTLLQVAAGLDPSAAEIALRAAGLEPEYLAIVDAETLGPPCNGPRRVLATARLGAVRLLDNVPLP